MKVLLVSTNQFGYLIDYYRYYTYLKNRNISVRYLCLDYKKERMEPGNPDVIYVSNEGNKSLRTARFIKAIVAAEKEYTFDKILIHYFLFASSLLTFIRNEKMVLDIRTVSIHVNKRKRRLFDSLIRFAASRFKNVSIINDLSAKLIGIGNYKLLPLGGAIFSKEPDDAPDSAEFKPLFTEDLYNFLYVGTLHKRRVIECVKGFHSFLQKRPLARARFIIIGQAMGNELNEINDYISAHGLHSVIITTGYIPQHKLSIFFKYADCGVSFVPLTPFFDVQPSTKTYEYLINGIPVIATCTQDNTRLLEESGVRCGILIKDNAEAFESALLKMIDTDFDAAAIAEEFRHYEWDNLFRKYLDTILSI